MSLEQKKYILEETSKIGIDLTERQIDQFLKYYDLLVEKNKVMNLTAITEFEEVVQKHFVDSLSIVKSMNMESIKSMLDLGTGAGFPGVPIKIAYPHIEVTLADSLDKRIRFLNEVIEALELETISTVHGRAEDLARNVKYRENFELCTSRAVARLSVLSEYCIPFVKVNGSFISYKSGSSQDEIKEAAKAIKILGGSLQSTTNFELYEMGRTLVSIKKVKATPKVYPRKAGTPSRKPIQ